MDMKNIEGQIEIDMYPQRKNKSRVKIRSGRPVLASRIMIGKQPEEALTILPLMFNVCAVAQARTGLSALQDSLDITPDHDHRAAMNMLVLVENAREHLFRILLDWPALFDLAAKSQALPQLAGLINDFKLALFADGIAFAFDSRLQPETDTINDLIQQLELTLQQSIYHLPSEEWLQIKDIDSLYRWTQDNAGPATRSLAFICDHGWSSQGFSSLHPLPELDNTELIERLDAADSDEFIARPRWHGQHYETSPLSRQIDQPLMQSLSEEFHNTLITRWVSRLVELARIPQQLRSLLAELESAQPAQAERQPGGAGIAQTEAARGRLIHRVQLEQGSVSQYQIVAPTEWNFHPQGLVAQSLENLSSNDPEQLKLLARIMINAIDPCVGYDLRIKH